MSATSSVSRPFLVAERIDSGVPLADVFVASKIRSLLLRGGCCCAQVSVNREVLLGRPFSECVRCIKEACSSECSRTKLQPLLSVEQMAEYVAPAG